MNTKTLKGILLYSLIIIAVVLLVFGIMILLMFIFPNLKLFGYGMISKNQTITNTNIISTSGVVENYNLAVNAGNFDLSIIGTEDDKISYKVIDHCFGASNVFKSNVKESAQSNGYSLTLTEPNGIILYKNSSFTVYVPKNLIYNLTVKTDGGNINVTNITVDNLNVTTGNGNFYLKEKDITSLTLSSLYIQTNSGAFNFKDYANVEVIDELIINSNKGNFLFNNLTADVKINSKDVYFEAINVTTCSKGFEANIKNIVLKISNALTSTSQNSILTSSCLINIANLTGTTSIKSSNGDITFGIINSECVIYSSEGNVKIDKAKEYIKVESKYADITVKEFEKNAYFINSNGKITAKSTSLDTFDNTIIRTGAGNVTFETAIAPFNIKCTGTSSVNLTINKFYYGESASDAKQYVLEVENGNALVKIDSNSFFKYIAKGDIDNTHGNSILTPHETAVVYPPNTTLPDGISEEMLSLLKVIGGKLEFKYA